MLAEFGRLPQLSPAQCRKLTTAQISAELVGSSWRRLVLGNPDLGADQVDQRAYVSAIAEAFHNRLRDQHNALNQGNSAQRKRWLRPIVTGEVVGTFATSEPGASSDLSPDAVQTTAIDDDDGWVVNGRKRWITNAPISEGGVLKIALQTLTYGRSASLRPASVSPKLPSTTWPLTSPPVPRSVGQLAVAARSRSQPN